MKRPTIKDIAKAAGVSITTVSLVLNKKAAKIPAATKKRIERIAKEAGYRPYQVAVSLVKKRSNTIGLIIPDIGNVFFSHIAKGIGEVCSEAEKTLFLCNTGDIKEKDTEYIKLLADNGVEGIIYIMSRDNNEKSASKAVKALQNSNIPFILLDRFVETALCPQVYLNHRKGGYIATKHLIDLKHKKIACITGPKQMPSSKQRFQGFIDACEEAKIEYDEKLIYEGGFTLDSGVAAIDYFEKREYTALFACNDLSAFGACKRLTELGKKVPEDVSVVGYDDVVYASLMAVPLTTVHQPVYEMGKLAVNRLFSLMKNYNKNSEKTHKMDNNTKMTDIIIEPKLVVRKSTIACG
ncbi:MAG: LacI family transcriptional regulator [Lachnospiraceae bacterium]|jgi:LacI family transcriptional regulator|nr:LacI family transcriptional regulator [Lachnospiraceae bacterium]